MDVTKQAIVASMLFGVDAGIAATEGERHLYIGTTVCRISPEARALLAEAWDLAQTIEPKEGLLTVYDLRNV